MPIFNAGYLKKKVHGDANVVLEIDKRESGGKLKPAPGTFDSP